MSNAKVLLNVYTYRYITGIQGLICNMRKIREIDIELIEKYYTITADGEIWSHHSNRFLRPKKLSEWGYKRVNLILGDIRIKYLVHRIIATKFVENPNNYELVYHKDGNLINNKASNLEWSNMKQINRGRKATILTQELADEIRDIEGMSSREIGTMYGVSKETIKDIRKNRSWIKT